MVIELGAGTTIPSVRRFARSLEVPIVRINPKDHRIDLPHIGLQLSALKGLLVLEQILNTLREGSIHAAT